VRGYIRTRRGPTGTTYQLAAYVGLDDRGRQRYRYETVRGSRRDAEHRLTELVTAVGIGDLGTNGTARFDDLVNAWWEVSTNDLSPNTRIGCRGILDRHLLPAFGNRRLDRIGPAELERVYGQLLDSAAPRLARPLSAATVYKVHNPARALMTTAVRWGWMQNNPASRAKPPRARVKPAVAPSVEDGARALDAASEVSEELHVFLWLSVAPRNSPVRDMRSSMGRCQLREWRNSRLPRPRRPRSTARACEGHEDSREHRSPDR
jgi:hypothetical protein